MPIILDRDTNFIPISRLILLFLQTWEECTQYFRVDEERGLSPGQVKDLLSSYFLKFTYFHFLIFTSLVSRWRSTRRSTAPTVSSSTISDVNVDGVVSHTHACPTYSARLGDTERVNRETYSG